MTPIAPSLQQPVDAFLRYLKVERQLSPLTQLSYSRQLAALMRLAQGSASPTGRRWTPPGTHAGGAQQTRRPAVRQPGAAALFVAQFPRLAGQPGRIARQPAKGIRTPRSGRHLPKNIDVDEMNQLLEIDLNDPLAVRDRAMLEVMYGAGLRLSELVGLDCRHVDMAAGEVWVMGKGSKERKLPIGRTAVTWLEHWLAMRDLFGPEDDAMFLSNQGRRISTRNVQKRFAEWGVKQGVNSHIHPHCATPSLPTCWSRAAICARCRSCSATPT